MNKSKQNRRLKSLWYKRDFDKWIKFKEKTGRYPKGTKSIDKIFLIDSAIWNARFTHEEEINRHYPDWNPYCCNMESYCSSRAWDRMTKTENGWKCEHCGVIIGKHLYRTLDERDVLIKSGNFHNFRGTPDFEYVKLKRPVTQIAIGEKDINVLKDFMETNQRVFPNLDVVEIQKPKIILYSARDIAELYPNNLGLQKALSQFIMQMKIRVVEHKMVRVSAHTTQIRVGYYNARKLKKALEDYILKADYKLCGERKKNLTTLLELITNKIDKEVEDEKKSGASSHS